MARTMDLRRHTQRAGDADQLSPEGVRAAVEIGARLDGDYHLGVSTGAQRATQTLACFLAGMGRPVAGGVIVEPGLRSSSEGRWRQIYKDTGSVDLAQFRAVEPEFVEDEAFRLGEALRRVFDALADGQRALMVGHTPTNEAAAYALTGSLAGQLAPGAGVRVVHDGRGYRAEPLP